jgi:hypothetical protein
MFIVFATEKLQKFFNSSRDLARKYGPENARPRKPDGGLDWPKIDSIRILNVEDYHD